MQSGSGRSASETKPIDGYEGLTHPAGADFDENCWADIPLYKFDLSHDISQTIVQSQTFKMALPSITSKARMDIINGLNLVDQGTEVKTEIVNKEELLHFTNDGIFSDLFTSFNYATLYYNAVVTSIRENDRSCNTSIEITGAVKDIYDWDYDVIYHPGLYNVNATAAIVQHGYNSGHDPVGRVFAIEARVDGVYPLEGDCF